MEFVDGFWLPPVGVVTCWHFYLRHHDLSGQLIRTDLTSSVQNIAYADIPERDALMFLEALQGRWQGGDAPPSPDFAVN